MKRIILILATLTFAVGCTPPKTNKSIETAVSPGTETIPGQFVFRGDKDMVATYLNSMGIAAKILPVDTDLDIYEVNYSSKVDYSTLAGGLEGKVKYVEPVYKVHSYGRMDKYSWPNDKYFFKQWALNNIGQSAPFSLPGTEGADVDYLAAKEKSKGGKKIIVAVIDTGIDYTHPDLKENMWVNEKEAEENGGIKGKDDDGNGLIDDVYGYDFFYNGSTKNEFGIPGDPDPMDEGGHGTHCAGTIGAIAGNAEGIVGLSPNVKLMALRFLGDGGGSTVAAVRAINYAIKKEANIMSNSWGGGGDSEMLRDVIAKAEKAGILFVAAAGNDSQNIDVQDSYPASYDSDSEKRPINNVLSVGASDNQDNPADFSNYGHQKVHVYAPGVMIVSTYPVKKRPSQPYAVMSGTSMAAPFVSGLAAMMMSANPGLIGRPADVKQIIMDSSDQKDSLIGKAASNGRINAARALAAGATKPVKANWVTRKESVQEKGYPREVVDIRKEITVPGAKAIRVHFDFIQIEKPYDNLFLYDSRLRLIANIEKISTTNHWSAVVPGDKVTVRFTNSLVQQVTVSPIKAASESECLSMGAAEVLKVGPTDFNCMTDTQDNSGSKAFATFNSEGFSIDKIEYLPGDKK